MINVQNWTTWGEEDALFYVLYFIYVWIHEGDDLCSNSQEIHNFVLHSFWHYESILSGRSKNNTSAGTKQSNKLLMP
jgi:hypothetical protein